MPKINNSGNSSSVSWKICLLTLDPEMELVEIFLTRPDPTCNMPVGPASLPAIVSCRPVFDRPVDRQNLQNLDEEYSSVH